MKCLSKGLKRTLQLCVVTQTPVMCQRQIAEQFMTCALKHTSKNPKEKSALSENNTFSTFVFLCLYVYLKNASH